MSNTLVLMIMCAYRGFGFDRALAFWSGLKVRAGGRFRCDSIMIANDKFDDRTIN